MILGGLLKGYMTFLRQASRDAGAFDRAFLDGREAWSRLYWEWFERPGGVEVTIELSKGLDSSVEREWKDLGGGGSREACLSRKVDLELEPMPFHRWPSDFWPLRRC